MLVDAYGEHALEKSQWFKNSKEEILTWEINNVED